MFRPVDNSSQVVFRIAFGAALAAFAWSTLTSPSLAADYIQPVIHLTYYGFDWVRPWAGDGMYVHFLLMFAAAVGVSLGLWYRVSAFLLLATFTHVFLIERSLYNNHYYLIILLAFLANVIPLQRGWSMDSVRSPSKYNPYLPQWTLWLLRFQIGIVYIFGGIAKLDSDWLRGQPMRMWLSARADFPVLGQFVTEDWFVGIFAWGGLLIDLLAVPALMWRRTRVFACVALLLFHLINSFLFTIGLFPWLMIAASTIFFPPDWPRKLFRIPNLAHGIGYKPGAWTAPRRVLAGLLATYIAIQILVPLRSLVLPGNPSWTESGQLFSWRMMLRQKQTGIRVLAIDTRSGRRGDVDLIPYLNQRQATMMSRDPDLIVQFCQKLASELNSSGNTCVELRVKVLASLNGRKPQLLIDPNVDLAREPRRFWSYPWVLPLTEPLRHDAWDVPIQHWESVIEGTGTPGTSRSLRTEQEWVRMPEVKS